ncbi:hypothetical protein [Pseudarthrobacter sp. BIM B-2242]|uniref:hypothetical protein n=1 Tax=Pseudarthrobacter sp. BIM B-2242 TaxID=2772401 RepID=UPI00168BDA54|nr:hypothetical protein [Pseudarthrobacter sp. BIM B-2242]QOD05658.1 hypothetical protein IDT60_21690 [Pseudarthrobacter sp. BIM B-2242]
MLGQGWKSQWRRVKKGLQEVETVYAGRDGGSEEALDAVCLFFQAAHHLKDWLGNDPESGVTKSDVDDLIDGSPMLQLCADLANGSKHLALTRTRTGDTSTSIARAGVTVHVGEGTVAHNYHVQSKGNEYDVLQIARAAVRELEDFLNSKKLLD